MKIFVSKKEIELIIKEYEDLISLKSYLNSKEQILTELISIKAYNIIKNDFNLANNYFNRTFSLSSLCPDINLADYGIKNIDILITAKNNVLSGFVYSESCYSKDAFFNVVKISNNLILSIQDSHCYDENSNLLRLPIIKKLLDSSNIQCILSLCILADKELNKNFSEEFKNRVFYNIFIASKLRKEKFDKIPNNEKEHLLTLILNGECSAGEYIYNLCEKSIPNLIQTFIAKTLDEFKNNIAPDIVNIDNLYETVSFYADHLIMDLLYSKIQRPYLKNSQLVLIDLIFVKDEIHAINKKQQEIVSRKKLIQSKIDKLNAIFDEIKLEISRVYIPSTHKTFSIDHSSEVGVRCCYFSVADRDLSIEGNQYKVKCIYFIRTNGHGFDLDEPLYLDDTLNLSITYRRRALYSISEEKRNRLLDAQKDILSLLDTSKEIY